ncbi:hypothetical protein GCM10009131_08210 [Morganella psychrotolerans]
MLTALSPPGHILMYAPRRSELVAYRHPELFRVCPVEFITGFFISGFSLMA